MAARPVLVTGFEPFGAHSLNPSHEAMLALDGRTIEGAPVVGRGLPVDFAALRPAIGRLVGELEPRAVIGLGLAAGEAVVRIERIAVNIAHFDFADNAGLSVSYAQVTGGGPPARLATVPLQAVEEALLARGIPARLSASAGTYLCNACLYWFLEVLAERRSTAPCGFLHVPKIPEQVAKTLSAAPVQHGLELHQRADLASMELSRIIAAAEIAVGVTLRASRV